MKSIKTFYLKTKFAKLWPGFLLASGILLLTTTACELKSCSSRERLRDRVILKINQTEISTQTFAEKLAQMLRGYDALQLKDEKTLHQAKEDCVRELTIESLTREYAQSQGVMVTTEELDARIQKIQSQYPDENAFRRALATEGLSLERWTADVLYSILQKKLTQHLMKNVKEPTEAELKTYYEAHRDQFLTPARIQLRQIVLPTEENARRILSEIEAGKNFAELAKKFSVAPEAENNGLTDWIEKGSLEVFDAAFKLPIGGRSSVVKSPYGYHIYEVLKKENEGRLSFEKVKSRIRDDLLETKQRDVLSDWLEAEVRKAKVFRNDTLIDAIEASTRNF